MKTRNIFAIEVLAISLSLGLVACGQASNASSSSEAERPSQAQVSASKEYPAEEFYISEITDEIFARIKGKSFKDECTLPREDLRYLHVLHKDKDGNVHEGEMIVNTLPIRRLK